jgi:hypothetical protein
MSPYSNNFLQLSKQDKQYTSTYKRTSRRVRVTTIAAEMQ